MKNIFIFVITSLVLVSCSKSNVNDENCKFLLNTNVNTNINLNLPQYSQLLFISNSVYVPNFGNKGIIVTNSGSGYLAWDAADPNHAQQSCSIVNGTGLDGTCGCADANTYSFITGQSLGTALPCTLKPYRVEQSGNTLFISN
jgi:nitrite reductase/ring-hydroxylating ferredoxin subunit